MARRLVSGIATAGLALLLLTGCVGGEVCCALPPDPANNNGLVIPENPPLDTVAELMKSSTLVVQVELLDGSEVLDASGFSSTQTQVRITAVLHSSESNSEPIAKPIAQPITKPITEPLAEPGTPPHTAQDAAPSPGDIIVVSQLGTRHQPESHTLYLRKAADPVLFLDGPPGSYSMNHPTDRIWLAQPDGSFASLSDKEQLTAPSWADLVAAIDSV